MMPEGAWGWTLIAGSWRQHEREEARRSLVVPLVRSLVALSWVEPIRFRRHNRLQFEFKNQLACLVACIGLVHCDRLDFPSAVRSFAITI